MSLNSILNIGVSGLMTAQSQLKVVSDNISNVNTPGYIRKIGGQAAQILGGKGAGVTATQVTLAADKYLQSASLKATSATSQAEVFYEMFDQIQSQFGDITNKNGLFNLGDQTLSAIATAAESTNSSAARQEVVSSLKSFLDEGARISDEIQSVRASADGRIATAVKSINELIKNISDLNPTISQANISGGDASGAQTSQSTYIDQLSKLIDVQVTTNPNGGVTVRTTSGMVLAGDQQASLSYTPTNPVTAESSFNSIIVTGPNGEKRDFADHVGSGELRGLLDVRDKDSTAVADQLSEYMSVYADKLNAAHNAATAVPAPSSLTGKALSQTLPEALNGFTGTTNIVIANADGTIAREVQLDFSTMQMSVDGGAAAPFSAASFESDVSGALGAYGSVSFTGGKLSLSAGAGYGVAVADDATTGSAKLGKGFSHYFGLNDIITSPAALDYNTGLTPTSSHGFDSGTVGFQLASGDGKKLTNVDVAFPAGGTMTDLVNTLNDSTNGLGRYGTFSLNPSTGALSFKGFGNPANTLNIGDDTTARLGTGGASFSDFFGLGGAAAERAGGLTVNPTVLSNLDRLSLAKVNLNAAAGSPALVSGDGTGGQAMAAIGSASVTFQKAGYNAGGTSSLTRYAADLAGQVGTLASTAKSRMEGAQALSSETTARRSATEGVNLDEELVNLTTFQQAYSASSRLIQAAKDMYDVLLNLI
ncbi:flagellar hook-associated protein FlgK [Asticcacaulis sp. BYS171W]|uniref:Flagellar hook-associated protein 1 n=1 Tax=Asticcacaulis aquaticus TaxID=2984212 RepID=A0ABT5HT14_9CAUL|nr:flagellar hook-associated protein FlgK [Asticcacaulis aquaticus]MDC7683174.1 flagellar hook-associated protein FlgK [Asticcacaulis aquaticus]